MQMILFVTALVTTLVTMTVIGVIDNYLFSKRYDRELKEKGDRL